MILKKISSSGITLHVGLILVMLVLMLFSPFPEMGMKQNSYDLLPLYNLLNGWGSHLGVFWLKLMGIVLIGTVALLFNWLVIKGDLLPKKGAFVIFIYFVLILAWDNLSFTLMAFALTMLLFYSLFSITRLVSEQQNYASVLNATISISVASMIAPQTILFMLFVWLGFFTLRISAWREWIISLIGLLTPWFYYAVYLFFTDGLVETYTAYLSFFREFRLNYSGFGNLQIAVYAILVLIVLISVSAFVSDAGERVISIRKKMWLNVHFLWIGLLVMVLSAGSAGLWLPVVFMPVSLIVSHRIVFRRKSWVLDGAVIILFVLIVGLMLGY